MAFDPYEYIDPQYRDPDEEIRRSREAIAGLDAPDYAPFTLDEVDPLPPQQLPAPPARDLDALMSGAAGTAPDITQAPGPPPMTPEEQSDLLEFIESSTGVTPEGTEAEVARRKFAQTPSAPAPVGGAMISGPGGPAIAAPTLGGARQPYRDELPFDRALRMQRDARQGAIPLDILSGVAGGLAGKVPTGPTFGEMRSGAVGRDLIREGQQSQRRQRHSLAMAKIEEKRAKVAAAQQKEQRTSQANTAALQSEYGLSPEDAAEVAASPDAMRIVTDSRKQKRKLEAEAADLKRSGEEKKADRAFQLAKQLDKHNLDVARDKAKAGLKRRPGRGGGVGAGVGGVDPRLALAESLLHTEGNPSPSPGEIQERAGLADVAGLDRKGVQMAMRRVIPEARKRKRQIETDVGKLAKEADDAGELLDTIEETNQVIEAATDEGGDVAGVGQTGFLAAVPFGEKLLSDPGKKMRQQLRILNEVWARARTGAAISVTEEDRFAVQTGLSPSASDEEMRIAINVLTRWAKANKAAKEAGKTPEAVEQWNRQRKERRQAAGLAQQPGEGGKTVAKKEFSASRNQTRITYADGSTEVIDGRE